MTCATPAPTAEGRLDPGTGSGAARPVWIRTAFAFTLLFLSIHLYWALGGTWGLPLLALHDRSTVRAANWVVSAIMVIGAVVVLALDSAIGRRVPSWMLLAPVWIGAVVCVSHGLYGVVTKGLYLGGHPGAVDFPVVPGVSPAAAADRNHLSAVQDLVIFEPCFAIQGVVLALAGWQSIRAPRARRRWSASVVAGIVVIDVFGALLSLSGGHVAIS